MPILSRWIYLRLRCRLVHLRQWRALDWLRLRLPGLAFAGLAIQVLIGCAAYAVLALATDLCGCRDLVRSALGRPMRRERLR